MKVEEALQILKEHGFKYQVYRQAGGDDSNLRGREAIPVCQGYYGTNQGAVSNTQLRYCLSQHFHFC